MVGCLTFFQALLTGGYAYAYWLLGRLRNRRQGIVHLAFLGVSAALLVIAALSWPSPLTPDASWRPQGSGLPVWGIFRVLAVAVGIPYLLLSSNSSLVQAWFHHENHGQTPYRLYALSNIGSLLGLISYPFLFEPILTLRAQAYVWSAGYLAFAISAAYLALRTYRRLPADEAQDREDDLPAEGARPGVGTHILWIVLAACATTLLISVTSQITQEVAVKPFLWVLPLTIYLLTFILAFSGGIGYSRRIYLIAFFAVALASDWMLVKYPPFDIVTQIIIYSLLLFIACMICHNELFSLRPHPRFLSSFYLMIAVGGAVGGIFVTLLAPYIFTTGFWELQWGLVLCGALLALIIQLERTAVKRKRAGKGRQREVQTPRVIKPVVIGLAAALLLQSVFIFFYMRAVSANTMLTERNFYGLLRVWENNTDQPTVRTYELTHGKTAHGFQFESASLRDLPTTYYTEKSGVGLAITNEPARPANIRVGALGLGIGVLASYGQPGDVFRFYEINPDVIQIAEGQGGYFSFLADSKADVQIVPGDARLSLKSELASDGPENFDLLVLDTFNGDAMPLHLLTREAFEIYLKHLKPNGIMAINVSNRYFNLPLEVYRLADAFDLGAALIENSGDAIQSYDSVWMLLTRDRNYLNLPAITTVSQPRPAIPAGLRVWTDDYSNLVQILK
jgi:MFS family permease